MNIHNEMILAEYDEMLPIYRRLERIVEISLQNIIDNNGLTVTAVSARVKSRESLAGKLALKGDKYHSLGDITDILGARIITFYTDDVDRIAALTEKLFDIDWKIPSINAACTTRTVSVTIRCIISAVCPSQSLTNPTVRS